MFSDWWFRRHRGPFYLGVGGFPSGHTLVAFSVAMIFAERYRNHRWVRWVAYTGAGAIAFSRITKQAHFPSDVFAGAVLGYIRQLTLSSCPIRSDPRTILPAESFCT